ncbi:MAG: hypothetical protein WC152_05315 [Candidatus Izemoplasmatales bacterium]
MISKKIGVNIKNLEYSVIKKKSNSLSLVLGIIGFTCTIMVIPFLILWFLKVPIEINDITREYYEIEYKNFMIIFNSIFAGISIFIFSIVIILSVRKPKDYIFINKDMNFTKFFQVNINKNKLLFITDSKTFYYNKKTEKINNVHGKEEILELRNTYLFWEKWEDIKDYRVVSKNKKTILIFNYENKGTVLNYRYYFPTLSSNLPEKITEIINKRTTTSNSTASFNTYYFTENNRQINHRLPDKIVQALFESN